MRRPGAALWLVGAALCALAAPARAQETAPDPAPAAAPEHQRGKQVFTPADYARYAPRTAWDMVSQTPGFVVREGDEERGLGQASTNVLVNGQRISGKTDGIETRLRRIPASNVERIELVDAATLDLPGLTGQVANVVVKAGGLTGQFSWKGEARPHFTQPLLTNAAVSISGSMSPALDYSLALDNTSAYQGGAGGPSRVLLADGSLFETRDDVIRVYGDKPRLSGSLAWHGPGGVEANINGLYRQFWNHTRINDTRQRPGGVDRARAFRGEDNGHNWEAGGDLAFGLGPGRLKLIGLARGQRIPSEQQAITSYADGSPATGDRFLQTNRTAERIARAEYGWKLGGADWQLSAEAAFNRLDTRASLASLDSSGAFVPVAFPGGTGGVKEARYEAMLSYSRPLTRHLSLQLAAGGELSRLSQTGANAVERRFRRAKGSASLAWTPAKGLDLSFKVNRKVGQLDFGDFLASVFLDSNNANAGNRDLVPPQSWEFDLEAVKSLGPWGTTRLRFYDRRIEDLVDFIPIGADGESLGNLPRARRYGVEWIGTLMLDLLGFKGARLDTHVQFERSRVRDPLTGVQRPISETEDRVIEIDLRHDMPRTPIAWGVHLGNYHYTDQYRLVEQGLSWEGPTWVGVFVEHKDVMGLTVNLRAGNLLSARNRLDRVVHTGFRDRTPVAFEEHRSRLIGPIFTLSVKGAF